MKKILLTVVLCAATLLVVRAQSQRGTVVIQNSGKKALPSEYSDRGGYPHYQ